MQNIRILSFQVHLCLIVFMTVTLSCEKDHLQESSPIPKNPKARIDIGWGNLDNMNLRIFPRSHGYVAEARGKGIIPSGEYAGQRFQIRLEGIYSGIGNGTLTSGEALVSIRGERFESVNDPLIFSFCCGEGDLIFDGTEYTFTMYGQMNHNTAAEPHRHLFAGLATTAGTMNMNIADQTGSIVIPVFPPHDPGIGLIEDFDAQYVRVDEH